MPRRSLHQLLPEQKRKLPHNNLQWSYGMCEYITGCSFHQSMIMITNLSCIVAYMITHSCDKLNEVIKIHESRFTRAKHFSNLVSKRIVLYTYRNTRSGTTCMI